MTTKPIKDVIPIHHLTVSEIPRAGQVLARAFRNDRLTSYFSPAVADRELLLSRFYRWLLRYGLAYGEVHASSPNLEGVAVWLPAENRQLEWLNMAEMGGLILPFFVGPRFFFRSLRYSVHIGRLRQQHVPFPHFFLQLLGVDPDCQRQGHATRLLRSMLERPDREKMTCCLDTWTRENVGFYERFGFRVAEESHLSGTTAECWLMVRNV